jgi:phage terminase large subunit GpA-like protein
VCEINTVGSDWAEEKAGGLTCEIVQRSPVEFNEGARLLPAHVTSDPGYIRFKRTPYWIEILECFDVRSPVREVAVLKGVQTAYSTLLESIVLYFAAHVKTAPCMYVNTTIDAARARIKRNYIPMFQQSGLGDIFQSSDVDNTRKRGITKDELQWIGGGYLVPRGAQNPRMAREIAILLLLMDELDDYARVKDGDTIQLFKDRTAAFKDVYKCFMGCTPTDKGQSFIEDQYLRGDQRQYYVRCLECGMEQRLRFSGKRDDGTTWGMKWDFKSGGRTLDIESVRYECKNPGCRRAHMEHDKVRLITEDNAFWKPTADPAMPNCRSYQVTGMMSRRGKWYSGVEQWLAATGKDGKVKDPAKLKVFYNNFLAETFQTYTGKIEFQMASAHRRMWYHKGEIKNATVSQYCDSEILFLTCTVDVHGDNLAVAVWGWARVGTDFTCWLIDYTRIYDTTGVEEGVSLAESPVWDQLRDLGGKTWTDDRGRRFPIAMMFIDANPYYDTVCGFCEPYQMTFPIMGRDIQTKSSVTEWRPFTTQIGTPGYLIYVDYYKDRLAPVLRRNWRPDEGNQPPYTFNAPMNIEDDELRELTREAKGKEINKKTGREEWVWHRPGNAPQELWDLMVYGHAGVEILAWLVSETLQQVPPSKVVVDWVAFWRECEAGMFFQAAA